MSQCKKFAPNIFHKTKCSNCFRQKEEHSAEALECNRASRSVARSGYLFVAPDWDFSVPLNRTKRWQRRWFVLYDDGELNYSVDEHPDTVPQGSVDMAKVLEVTGAEQVTGHPHSLALTSPDRVTFVKAASREDARWWAELLAVFPRRHKRNATFPGGRASPSLPQLGRSASPQPPRPRHLSVTGASPRTNFTTPPLKEERESPPKDETIRSTWTIPEPTSTLVIETNIRKDYIRSSGSPPTRDKLRCDDKAKARRDWRNERLRDIATALTDRSPESSLALPAEGLLHLKKGWLWLKDDSGDWLRRWVVLCGPSLNIYLDQDEQGTPEITVEMSSVTSYSEIPTESKYGFQIQWNGLTVTLSAVTAGIRNNWLQALKKGAPNTPDSPPAPATPRSLLLSSDDEYRTASEGGRRGSEDWGELPPSPPLTRTALARVKERARTRPRLPCCQSRQSTLDSVSTDELDAATKESDMDLKNTINKQRAEIDDLQKQLSNAINEVHNLEEEINRFKKIQAESENHEKRAKEVLHLLEQTERDLNQRNSQMEIKYLRDQKNLQRRLSESEENVRNSENKCSILGGDLKTKQFTIMSLQEELACAKERLNKYQQENDRLYKRLQDFESKTNYKTYLRMDSLTDLTNIDLDVELDTFNEHELMEHCLDLRSRFEKAVIEIRTVKRQLRDSQAMCDNLEIENLSLKKNLDILKQESQANTTTMVARIDNLTSKLLSAEKQIRSKSKDGRDKRRSLSLKGRESFSINKEVEDKVTELEAKILSLEKPKRKLKRERSSERSSPIDDRSLRRLRRKSLDGATTSEPMKLLMRLTTLDSKVQSVMTSNESLNTTSANDACDIGLDKNVTPENAISAAKEKLTECLFQVGILKSGRHKRSSSPNSERLINLEHSLNSLGEILKAGSNSISEVEVVNTSANTVVKQLQSILLEKLSCLAEKKRLLQGNGKLDKDSKVELLAEKIAFENVIISRIQEALNSPATSEPICERLFQKEAIETKHLLSNLKNKLNGIEPKEPPICKTSAEYLSKILAKCLTHSAQGLKVNRRTIRNSVPSSKSLQEEQRRVSSAFEKYKSTKLIQIADLLAAETLSLSSDRTCRLHALNEEIYNDFSRVARESVNKELMQSEINHVLLRAAQIYEMNLNADNTYFFSFFASERAALELWSDTVESYLYVEIEKVIQEVLEQYQRSLSKLQRQNWRRRKESDHLKTSQSFISEFADVVAHKVLIDARVHVLESGNDQVDFEKDGTYQLDKLMQAESYKDFLEENSSVQINQSLEAEFKFMVNRYNAECRSILERSELDNMFECVNRLCLKVFELRQCANVKVSVDDEDVVESNDVCQKCSWILEQLENVQKVLEEAEVQITYKKLENEEERRPVYLGTEYLSQVENLRAAYRRALTMCEERHMQADLEQLQVLCERVLVAMEHWHRRSLHDLRESHSREMQLLRQDKEQALAEETQATLAALDAMRKAHEAEVQREVARFKQEFARQQRDELMDLSERLSVKCLEAAALEEQLSSATRQLAHAQQHILQLERNPQLSNVQN